MVIEYARPLGPEFGAVAQLVRVPDCRSGGCGFESRPPRYDESPALAGLFLLVGTKLLSLVGVLDSIPVLV